MTYHVIFNMENDRMGFYTGVYHFKNYLPYPREGGGKVMTLGKQMKKLNINNFHPFDYFQLSPFTNHLFPLFSDKIYLYKERGQSAGGIIVQENIHPCNRKQILAENLRNSRRAIAGCYSQIFTNNNIFDIRNINQIIKHLKCSVRWVFALAWMAYFYRMFQDFQESTFYNL